VLRDVERIRGEHRPTHRVTRRRAVTARPLLESLGIALATVLVLVFGLRLWKASWGVPFVYGTDPGTVSVYAGDAPFYLMLVQSMIVHGSYATNASLGAPFSQELHDLPHGLDNLQFAVLGLLGKITGSPAVTVNLYFLLTFVLVALVAHFTLCALGLRRSTAAALALVYTFLPYHFARGSAHILLSGYFMVPVAVLLILRVCSDRPPFLVRDSKGRDHLTFARPTWLWLIACVGIASTGPYYAFFTIFFLLVAAVAEWAAGRGRRALASAGVAVAAILAMAIVNMGPSIAYWARNGTNANVAGRNAHETEINGLKISQLVLPFTGHRIPLLRDLTDRANRDTPVKSENGQQLGVIGAVGFVGLLGLGLVALVGHGRRRPGATWPTTPVGTMPEVLSRLSMLTIVGCVTAAVSGFSLLVAALGAREIRSWNRISIFLGFFALLAVGYGVDRLLDRLGARAAARPSSSAARRWPIVRTAVLAGLVLVALLDQVTPAVVPAYAATKARWDSDHAFATAVADRLPDGAAVFDLPYVRFPEAGTVYGAGPYDEARGFLHVGGRLRWSFGGTVGRNGTWQKRVGNFPTDILVAEVAALGFDGIEVDTAAFGDEGGLIRTGLRMALHREADVVSPDRRLLFYDLRPYAAAQQAQLTAEQLAFLRQDALTPVSGRDDRPVPPPPPVDRVPQPQL
jgi:phosphoglycerol transferase